LFANARRFDGRFLIRRYSQGETTPTVVPNAIQPMALITCTE
jgi:hypothetical protein